MAFSRLIAHSEGMSDIVVSSVSTNPDSLVDTMLYILLPHH
jgi:hypothetical protein